MTNPAPSTLLSEFNRQVRHFMNAGLPGISGLSPATLTRRFNRLRPLLPAAPEKAADPEAGFLPFAIVPPPSWISPSAFLPLIQREGKKMVQGMKPLSPENFSALPALNIASTEPYLLIGIDRGKTSLNMTPEKAMLSIARKKRTPLTILEGLSVLFHSPDFLQKNNCFLLPGSRRNDLRIPALWIDGQKHPKLGWCWWRNPHTWLGTASCARRLSRKALA